MKADAPPDPDRKLNVTFFRNYKARTLTAKNIAIEDLRVLILAKTASTKEKLPWLKLATFGNQKTDEGSLRHNANVLSIDGLEADYDEEQISFGEAVAIIQKANLKALIYTSPSHSPEKPRWRILAPLSRPLPAALRSKLMARLNGVFGGVFSGETWTLSQAYYFGSVDNNPAHRCEYYGGDYIDFRDDLDAGALGKAEGKATGKAIGFEGHLALLGDGPGLKGFHVPLRDGIASFVATHPADFDREGLKKRLREHIDRAPKDKERPYLKTDKHIDALIDSAVKRYGQAKRTGGLPWREQRKNGMPLPSMHNARLAITAIGVACSYNTFHNKLLFGFEGEAQHEIQFLVGEVTDNGIIHCAKFCRIASASTWGINQRAMLSYRWP